MAPGYARNFLVPTGRAVYATPAARAAYKVVLPAEEARASAAKREENMPVSYTHLTLPTIYSV